MSAKLIYRYSHSLYEAAVEAKNVSKVANDCEGILTLILESNNLRILFNSPVISKEKKIEIIHSIFNKNVEKLTLDFLNLIIMKRRESLVREFFQNYLRIKDEKDGIIKPVFTSAVELKEDEKMKYKNDIDILTKKNSQPKFEVNPELIGGFTISVGDSMIDGSVKRQLELIKATLKTKI
jgi:F-type H+-transporting ATPase subunit delta